MEIVVTVWLRSSLAFLDRAGKVTSCRRLNIDMISCVVNVTTDIDVSLVKLTRYPPLYGKCFDYPSLKWESGVSGIFPRILASSPPY